jgi:hypothetical protein
MQFFDLGSSLENKSQVNQQQLNGNYNKFPIQILRTFLVRKKVDIPND